MFAAVACIFLGLVIGAIYGNKLFKPLKDQTVTVQRLDLRYDYIDSRDPVANAIEEGKPVNETMRMVLGYAPEWVKWPDFERTLWMNHTISMLWPQYNAAIGKMVLEMVQPYIKEYKKQYSWLTDVFLHRIDLGTFPMQIAGCKIYQTADDEVILEIAVQWGSNANVKASARVTLGNYTIEIPVQVFNLMSKAKARVTIKPLVDIIPCMGSVNVTLIDQPEIDFSVRMLGSCDLMAIPGIRQAAFFFLGKVVQDMIVYPSSMDFPIMENSGVPPPPQGMLKVKLLKGIHLTGGTDIFSKIDPFVEMSIRENRIIRSKTIWNDENPEWNEEMDFVIEDPIKQKIKIVVKDQDDFNDEITGIAQVHLRDLPLEDDPWVTHAVRVELLKPQAAKQMMKFAEGAVKPGPVGGAAAGVKNTANKATTAVSKGYEKTKDKILRNKHAPADEDPTEESDAIVIHQEPDKHSKQKHRGDKKKTLSRGHLAMEVTYMPFSDNTRNAHNLSKARAAQTLGVTSLGEDTKGVLVVHVVRGINLEGLERIGRGGSTTKMGCIAFTAGNGYYDQAPNEEEVDSFLQLKLHDPAKDEPDVQHTKTLMNENYPRWDEKFDFVMISATSRLEAVVMDKTGFLQGMITGNLKRLVGKKPVKERSIGHVNLDLIEVVRNRRIRDTWALQDTQKGEIELVLEWTPVELNPPPDPNDPFR